MLILKKMLQNFFLALSLLDQHWKSVLEISRLHSFSKFWVTFGSKIVLKKAHFSCKFGSILQRINEKTLKNDHDLKF